MTDFCLVSQIITVSSRDTAETKRQVLEHNLKHQALCAGE